MLKALSFNCLKGHHFQAFGFKFQLAPLRREVLAAARPYGRCRGREHGKAVQAESTYSAFENCVHDRYWYTIYVVVNPRRTITKSWLRSPTRWTDAVRATVRARCWKIFFILYNFTSCNNTAPIAIVSLVARIDIPSDTIESGAPLFTSSLRAIDESHNILWSMLMLVNTSITPSSASPCWR